MQDTSPGMILVTLAELTRQLSFGASADSVDLLPNN